MSVSIIGVDAGGTKTSACLIGQDGQIQHKSLSGYGNMTINAEEAKKNIGDAVAGCMEHCPSTQTARIYIGAAGIWAAGNRESLAAYLSERFPGCPARIEDDAFLALYAMIKGRDGILVIAGTGSIAYAKRGGVMRRAGGWGNILGDEGSGYDISRRALANVTVEHDEGQGYGLLSRLILQKLGTDVFGLVKHVHTAPKGALAGFLPVVEQAAEESDAFAAALLCAAGQDLARLVTGLARHTGFTETVPVAMRGGVLEKTAAVREEFIRSLDPQKFEVLSGGAPSELGAYYLFLEEQSSDAGGSDDGVEQQQRRP